MNVLLVAFPFSPVGPDAVGGAEQVLWELDRGLSEAGHATWVLGCEGSTSHGTLISHGPVPAQIDSSVESLVHARVRTLVTRTIQNKDIDLVHFHGVDFPNYLPDSQVAMLATLHLSPRHYPTRIFAEQDDRLALNCVSETQHRACPASGRLCQPVTNGVRLHQFVAATRKGQYLLALGRICPEKGYHHALRAAHEADLPLLLAGRVFPYSEHLRYFQQEIRPLLDARRRFVGAVGPVERARLLSGARCLVIPSLIEETSSLVAMEALASATPVVALRRGSLPEVIEDGRTGLLVEDPSQLVDAISRVSAIDPKTCRRTAEERFDSLHMVQRYLSLYSRLTRATPKRGLANVGT